MENEIIIVVCVAILYAGMLTLEFTSSFSRFSGFIISKNAIAYSLQNATLTITRFFSILMMPCLGLLIDRGIDSILYLKMVFLSYFLSFVGALFVFCIRKYIVAFYMNVITMYSTGKGLFRSIFSALKLGGDSEALFLKNKTMLTFNYKKINVRVFIFSAFIYTIHASGIFLTFYYALSFSENRVMITQLSGVINALGTVLLTFKLEPTLSLSIENKTNFQDIFFTIYLSRVFVFLFIAPLLVLFIYFFGGA